MSIHRHLPSAVPSIATARVVVGQECEAWGFPEPSHRIAVLLTSELVTNAVLHASGSALELNVTADAEGVYIACSDEDPGLPVPRDPAPMEPGGRGLALISLLASGWGHRPEPPPGKTVWLRVERNAVWPTND